MSGKIFVISGENSFSELSQALYEDENLFQELIERYPAILAGDQITPNNPRKWIMILREIGIPTEMDGGDRFSLDHLFIDQDAIPTFVEVKRSVDTRARREVVAQMLDYAANATQYWSIEQLQKGYDISVKNGKSKTLSEIGITPDDEISFWEQVGVNLRAGKIRLLFANDVISNELKAIIEYLNEQMRDTDVFGIEIKQYLSDDGITTLVPLLIGNTAHATQKNQPGSKSKIASREEFLNSFTQSKVKDIYTSLYDEISKRNLKISLEPTGITVRIENGTLLFWAISGGEVFDTKTIVIPYSHIKGVDNEILDYYRTEVMNLSFFKEAGTWHKWKVSEMSNIDDLIKFISVIDKITNKIRGVHNG